MESIARAAWLTLLAVPPAQWAFERFAPLPVAPSRMLAIALCLVALGPITVDALARVGPGRVTDIVRAGIGLAAPALALLILLGLVRVSGGPFGPVPGGRLRGTPGREAAPDWRATDAVRYVALELASGRSLETLVIRAGEDVYVAANYPEQKRWPHDVRRSPGVVLRVGDTLYPRRAVFVEDTERTRQLLEAMNAKYGFDVSLGTGRVWFFRLDPP